MSKAATVRARLEPHLKDEAEGLLEYLQGNEKCYRVREEDNKKKVA